jgi:citrate lyase synthetase
MGIGGIKFWTKEESNKLFKQAGFKIEEQITRGVVCFTKLLAQG